jgi:hypothetical protein
MGEKCHSVGTSQCATSEEASDACCPLSHTLHCYLRLVLLFPLRNTIVLAVVDTLYDIYNDFKGLYFRNAKPSLGISTLLVRLVTICIILSS